MGTSAITVRRTGTINLFSGLRNVVFVSESIIYINSLITIINHHNLNKNPSTCKLF